MVGAVDETVDGNAVDSVLGANEGARLNSIGGSSLSGTEGAALRLVEGEVLGETDGKVKLDAVDGNTEGNEEGT
jgi:hypothetical protein